MRTLITIIRAVVIRVVTIGAGLIGAVVIGAGVIGIIVFGGFFSWESTIVKENRPYELTEGQMDCIISGVDSCYVYYHGELCPLRTH